MAITINVNLDEILAALKDDLDFTGNADKYIKVNATADGFEFAAVSVGSTWGSITGTLSDQTDLQSALDLKANLAGASFTGDVSVTTSGSGDTLQLTNSGSGTTLNILNSGSGDFLTIDTNKLVVDNGGKLSLTSGTTSSIPLTINASAGQTANLLEVNDSSGSGGNLVNITSNGFINIRNTGYRTQIGSAFITMIAGTARTELRGNATTYFDLKGQTFLIGGSIKTNSSTLLELQSTTQGFLPPRMTGAQVEAISSPAEGLIAYATNAGAGDVTAKGLYIYNGTNWVSL